MTKQDAINNPAHYGGIENPYEAIKVIEAWQLDFHLGNVVKYIARAGKKTKIFFCKTSKSKVVLKQGDW